jgi:hypothetical protein
MKAYFFSALAVAIAIVAFSFTLPKMAPRTTYSFRFIGNVASEASVENEANWVLCPNSPVCDGINHVASELLDIPEQFTEIVGSPGVRQMKLTVDIQTSVAMGCFPKRYVSSVSPSVIGETINNCSDW